MQVGPHADRSQKCIEQRYVLVCETPYDLECALLVVIPDLENVCARRNVFEPLDSIVWVKISQDQRIRFENRGVNDCNFPSVARKYIEFILRPCKVLVTRVERSVERPCVREHKPLCH